MYAACKLHHVADGWAESRKEAFVRHVEREMEITVGVRHRRIVDTFAAFEVDTGTMVSVMPYCNGGSLAELLRKQGPLSERDARSVMLQLLCGLHHLHMLPNPIIHYDLKPANILFHDGEVRSRICNDSSATQAASWRSMPNSDVRTNSPSRIVQVKLSDFGLSKVITSAGGRGGASCGGGAGGGGSQQLGIELTSYGSGTHGYLPPECYEGADASRVCPKVDVFSAGVVHFVMLFYPNKPFFKRATQQQIVAMQPHVIRRETETLEFPAKISAEVQSFLRRALAPSREERPDVAGLLGDPLMQSAKTSKEAGK